MDIGVTGLPMSSRPACSRPLLRSVTSARSRGTDPGYRTAATSKTHHEPQRIQQLDERASFVLVAGAFACPGDATVSFR